VPTRGTKGKKPLILFISILLFAFILITVNVRSDKGPVFLDSMATWVVGPVQSAWTASYNAVADVIQHYFLSINASKENTGLKKEVGRLTAENNQLREEVLRQERITQLLASNKERPRESVVATVIGRDPTQWSRVVFIDKGTGHGLRENLAVMTAQGVIGHIIQSSAIISKVLLLTDGRSAVDSLFQGSRVSGVVVGTGDEDCDMKYVPITANVSEGDVILSSGLGGIFPKGLVLGKVTQVNKRKNELFQEIRVVPAANLSQLEEVLVLLP
jgi:rod shape-determining protein MreC